MLKFDFTPPSRNKHNNGFTLIEVLIALVIIGVIAAITVPSIIQNTQKKEFANLLIKSYSSLGQSLNEIGRNNGYPAGDYSFFNNNNFIDEFAKVANVQKKCNNSQDCFGGTFSDEYKYLNNGTIGSSDIGSGKSVITVDGQMYTFVTYLAVTFGLTNEEKGNLQGRIIVDVNGRKKPNKIGIDTFYFYIINGKGIVPAGKNNFSACNKNNGGQVCAARVLAEGGINY